VTKAKRPSCLVLILAAVALVGCRSEIPLSGRGTAGSTPPCVVTLFAAASTGPALEEITAAFRIEHGIEVQTNFAGSSTLAQQIATGAGADVFLSANETWVDFLEESALVAERKDLLRNRLVIVVPMEAPVGIRSPEDLLDPLVAHVALAEPTAVPAGIYARQALESLGLWDEVKPKVVAAADVRRALAFVETGAAEAGIVYATDVVSSSAVVVAGEIDPELTDPICYPMALLAGAAGRTEVKRFYDYLNSPPAAELFRKHGFTMLTPERDEREAAPPMRPTAEIESARVAILTPEEWTALRLSFLVAAVAAAAGLPLAVAIAYFLARARFSGKWICEAVVNLPLVLPPVVTGYLLLVLFSPQGPIGKPLADWLGFKVVFTWLGAALAAMVVSFPLMVRAIRLAFQGVSPRLEMAARSLGAGRLAAFRTVTLPLARRGIVAGWMLAFARSLGEFGATIMVAGNIEGQTRTIPLAIFTIANHPGGIEQSWRLVVLSILLACGALAASEMLEGSRSAHEHA